MGEDWQVGDLAMLVDGAPWSNPEPFDPLCGSVNTVRAVDRSDPACMGLWLVGIDSSDSYAAYCFRKIRPHTPDEQDAETIRLMNGAPAERDPVTVEGGR